MKNCLVKSILLFLSCTFLLIGCSEKINNTHQEKRSSIPDTILCTGWSGEEYCIISQNSDFYCVNLYDESMIEKDRYMSKTLGEISKYLPDGSIIVDNQDSVLITNKWQQPLDKTVGRRVAVTPDLSTLLYVSPDKSILHINRVDEEKHYNFNGIVDMVCVNNQIVWLKILQDDYQNTNIFFDFISGKVVSEIKGNHNIEFRGDCILLRPDLVDGNLNEKLYVVDMSFESKRELILPEEMHTFHIRLSENGKYAVAGCEGHLSIYETEDFSIISTVEIANIEYDLYQNSKSQMVSNNADFVIVFDNKSCEMVSIEL